MSWTNELYNIYERFCGAEAEGATLLPVSHSTANAQVELTIDEDGNFKSASKIAKDDMLTIIPVTEDSGARGSGVFPHPFADKLVYLAGDYGKYANGKRSDNRRFFEAYINQLHGWAESEFSHTAVRALLKYLEKGELTKDLVESRVFVVDPDTGRFREKKKDENGKEQDVDKINGIPQEDCMLRIRVQYRDTSLENRTWLDKTLYDSFIEYNSQNTGKVDLCYALGEELSITYKHPGKIRNAGDKGKLMSTNDESGFTYRGRFKDKEEAASVSYEFSQKAHNALKWLISRQGKAVGSLTVLVWDSCLEGLPSVYDSISFDDLEDFGDMVQTDYVDPNELDASYKDKLSRSICGYRNRLKDSPKAMVMMLDSATTGRVAMVMYTELSTSEFLANLEKWHNETAWIRFNSKKKAQNESSFSLDEIVNSTYGYEDEKNGFLAVKEDIRRDTFRRFIPCVVEGARLPADIMYALIDRASNPLAFSNYFNWQLVLEVTCGMLRKANFDRYREDCGMALDKNCTDRDYLYGRLLAWADMAESSTYDEDDKNKRITNARRYFNAFSNRPYSTWGIIYEKLRPYLDKIQGKKKFYYEKLFDEINDKFTNETYMNNDKLQPEFILAYSCQKNQIYNERQASGSKKNVSDENKED